MSRESILKIKEAELKAERIVEDAKATARAMIEDAEKNGRTLCSDTETSVLEENRKLTAQLRERTEQTLANANEDAREEVEKMRKDAFLNKRSAEKIVIRGLMSKCR